ncbi:MULTISPECIES: aromatic prenyltransferase [unclassified Streptomyces]|uniref:aromatic prenyltransferase n=1 Tax=unclassified Streptomyces TaxID=2593676 RepID=UPI0036E3FBCC
MSGSTQLADLLAGVEESAGLIDVACAREKVLPILEAYEDALPHAVIAFRVATNARHEGEFDCRFTMPRTIDPYLRARDHGLITETGRPAESLLADIQRHCPIDSYGIDFGIVGGFRKIWVYFPGGEGQSLATLRDLPSMPPSLAENFAFFADRGLSEKVDVVAIDYRSNTVNLYFTGFPDALHHPSEVLGMHRALGMPDPSEQMQAFCGKAFGLYATLSWDSPRIERLAFGVKTQDPLSLPARLGPKIEHFLAHMPYGREDPKMVYAAMTASGEEYYKLQPYYRFQTRSRLDQMPSVEDAADDVSAAA